MGISENKKSSEEVLLKNIALLATPSEEEREIVPQVGGPLPSIESLRKMVELVKSIVFPGFFDKRQVDAQIRSYYIGVNVEMLYSLLVGQIGRGLLFDEERDEEEVKAEAERLALRFIDRLPEIKRLLFTDVEAIFNNDPAVRNYGEVIFCYPVVQAMVHYRMAHELLRMGIPVLPRIITELAHSATGIDIHPGATIGEYFSIDHGTGVVIGETCIIGNHVTLYQGVTLGAKNFSLDSHGHPRNIPRHPIIEDNVTVYSNSTVLGRITVGHDSIIGGNVWLTHDVAPGSHVLQNRATTSMFMDGAGI
jgi:serine O-acetyltransferase